MAQDPLAPDTIDALLGPNSLDLLVKSFTETTAALNEASAAKQTRDVINRDGATQLVGLQKEKAAGMAASAAIQQDELTNMATALDRSKEIDDSFWLQAIEPIAKVFNMHEYSRDLLATDVQRAQQSLQVEDARTKLQNTVLQSKADEVSAKVAEADAVYQQSADKFVSLTQATALNRQASEDLRTRQEHVLKTSTDAQLAEHAKTGFITSQQLKEETQRRQSGDFQRRQQSRQEIMANLEVSKAQLGDMTREQLLSPETAKKFSARQVDDALRQLDNEKMASAQLSLAYRDAKLSNAATSMTPEELKTSTDFTPQEKATIAQRQSHAAVGAAEDHAKLLKTHEEANASMVRILVDGLTSDKLDELESEVAQAGGTLEKKLPDGTPIRFTSDQLKPLLKVKRDALQEAVTAQHSEIVTDAAVANTLGVAGRAAGVGSLAVPDAKASANLSAILQMNSQMMDTEAQQMFEKAQKKFAAAEDGTNPNIGPQVRLELQHEAMDFLKKAQERQIKARMDATPDSLKPATQDFIQTGQVNNDANAVQIAADAMLNNTAIAHPGYNAGLSVLKNAYNAKISKDALKSADSVIAAMALGKQKPIDLAGTAAREQATQDEAARKITGPFMGKVHAAAAKELGMTDIAAAIEAGAIYRDKQSPVDVLLAVERAKGKEAVTAYLDSVKKLTPKMALEYAQPVGYGDLQIAAMNRLLFVNNAPAALADSVTRYTEDAYRKYFKMQENAEANKANVFIPPVPINMMM